MKFTYPGVEVKDMDESLRFYRDALGMDLLDRSKIPETDEEVAALRSKDSPQVLELNWYPNATYRNGSELNHLGFEVADVREAIQRLLRSGATLARDVEDRPGGPIGYVREPNGIWIELYEVRKS